MDKQGRTKEMKVGSLVRVIKTKHVQTRNNGNKLDEFICIFFFQQQTYQSLQFDKETGN